MSVELKKLYDDIYTKSDMKLMTQSCFHKHIGWVHLVENIDFIPLLHGDELVFNSSLNDKTDTYRKHFIDDLIHQEAGGLILALQDETTFPDALIEYCNERKFPVFKTSWETSFLNIMRRFSEILLSNERNETTLIAALKNAIYYPSNESMYVKHFERNDYLQEMPYTIIVIENAMSQEIPVLISMLRHRYEQSIVYEEPNRIVLLTIAHSPEHLERDFSDVCKKYTDLHVGIGSLELNLGTYQIICNIKNPEIVCNPFMKQTLGKLYEYDLENHTNYLQVLKDFFDNDCSIVQTANATFFHQNTLKYKIKHIREILGYDITSNENRTKIMLCFYMLSLSDIHFDF